MGWQAGPWMGRQAGPAGRAGGRRTVRTAMASGRGKEQVVFDEEVHTCTAD